MRLTMRTHAQKFGPRKAFKYRKYAADLREDMARLPTAEQTRLIGLLRQACAALDGLALACDPPGDFDPYDGL